MHTAEHPDVVYMPETLRRALPFLFLHVSPVEGKPHVTFSDVQTSEQKGSRVGLTV